MASKRELTKKISELALEFAQKESRSLDLCGLCAIASAALYQAMLINNQLFGSNYEPNFIYGKDCYARYSHCWVECDNKVYDPTWKQWEFDIPYYIGLETVRHLFFVDRKVIVDLKDMYTWEEKQSPTQDRINWFLEELYGNKLKLPRNKQHQLWHSRDKYYSFANQIRSKGKLSPYLK